MKNPLGKTEIVGLTLLVLTITGIIICAVVVKSCNEENEYIPERSYNLETIDSIGESESPGVKKTKTSRKRGGRKKKGSGKRKKASIIERPDPFSDTIPVY